MLRVWLCDVVVVTAVSHCNLSGDGASRLYDTLATSQAVSLEGQLVGCRVGSCHTKILLAIGMYWRSKMDVDVPLMYPLKVL